MPATAPDLPADIHVRDARAADYPALAALWSETHPDDVLSPTELAELDASLEPPYRVLRLVAEAPHGIVGTAVFKHSVGSFHPRRFLVDVEVTEAQRGRGIGAALYARLREALASHRPIGLRAQVRGDHPGALRFAEDRGFVETKRDTVSALELDGFDPAAWRERVERLEAAGVAFRSLADLETDGVAWRRPFFELRSSVRRDVPRSEPVADIAYEWFAKHVLDAPDFALDLSIVALDGRAERTPAFVGLTEVWRGEHAATTGDVHTGLTGVLPAWRGRGLATALKAVSLGLAKAQGHRRVHTDNDARNGAMLAVNRRLGFEPGVSVLSVALELDPNGDEASPSDPR